MLKSSVGQQQMSAFESRAQGARQQIAETGRLQANQLRQQIEDKRNSVIGQLYQSADPAGAKQQAISTAAGFAQPSVFGPIANMFADLINNYYTSQMINATKQGNSTPTYMSPDFNWGGVNTGAVDSGVTSRRIP